MNAEKKCPHCGEWTKWNRLETDTCEHCHRIILEKEVAERKKKELEIKTKEEEEKNKWPFTIKENDSLLLKGLKITGKTLHTIYIAIMSAIVWILFWLAS